MSHVCASLPENLRFWPCSEHRLGIYNLLDPVLHVNTCWGRQYERIMEWTSHQNSKVILGEVAEVTLAQPLSKTFNGGQNAAEETKRCPLPAHISNYCQRETR